MSAQHRSVAAENQAHVRVHRFVPGGDAGQRRAVLVVFVGRRQEVHAGRRGLAKHDLQRLAGPRGLAGGDQHAALDLPPR